VSHLVQRFYAGRPFSVSAIGVLICSGGVLALLGGIQHFGSTAALTGIGVGTVQLVVGLGLLFARRWAFYLTVLTLVVGTVALVPSLVAGESNGLGFLIGLVMLAYLVDNRCWFAGGRPEPDCS